jgi:hypothetical protein
MKGITNFLLVILLCVPTLFFAQKNQCGTDFTSEMELRLHNNIRVANDLGLTTAPRVTRYIPIKFHILANNDGTSKASTAAKVLQALCALNENYADQEVVFYLAGIYDMNNTITNSHSNVTAAQFQMSVRKNQHNNALNVFVCSSVNTNSGVNGIVLGYYTPLYDLIAIRANQMNTTSTTLTHEAGHFFSLPHPFNGWEGVDYHTTDNPSGAPYGAGNLPPTSMGGVAVELANGSNCANSGDFFCDTQADYNLGFLGGNNCNYTQGAVDPTGAAINPDETLYMSYFSDNCQDKFTAGQKAAIAADIISVQRNYLTSQSPSTTTPVAAVATLMTPANNAVTPYYDEVYLNWDDVPNATMYLVQIGRTQNFSLIEEEVIVTNSAYTAQGLNASTNYYWRVMALNEVTNCNGFSSTFKFTTSTFTVGTEEIINASTIKLQPNVAQAGQTVNLNINTTEKVDATIRIVNLAGQVVKNIGQVTFATGETIHELTTDGLASGVYIVHIQTEKGQWNERLLIQ